MYMQIIGGFLTTNASNAKSVWRPCLINFVSVLTKIDFIDQYLSKCWKSYQ